MSILRGCTASAGAVVLVPSSREELHSNSSLSILTNVMLMHALGGTGNQMLLPAAALFSNR